MTMAKILSELAAFFVFLCLITEGCTQCSSSNLKATETLTVNDTKETFATPGYRVAYFPNMDCKFIFDAERDDATIVFDIREILMESSSRCAFDSITFYQAAGSCSGSTAAVTATTTLDYITSPGYPVSLAHGVDCSWTIACDPTTVLFLQIEYSDLEYTTGCSDHILAIYDGTSSSDPALLESWCDSKANFPTQTTVYYTAGNSAFISLQTSAESIADRHGFKLNFKQNSTAITTTTTPTTTTTELVQVCSSTPTILEADETTRYFRSLNYPNYYPSNLNCFWLITAPIGYTINLTFVDSEMQSSEPCTSTDYVSVYDGNSGSSPKLLTFCGTEAPAFASTGRYLYILFKSDPTDTYRGFSAAYFIENATIPDCVVSELTGNLTATEAPLNFMSTNYPNNYNDSTVQYWLIHNPNQTQALAIEVTDSRIESSVDCVYDRVQIYSGACTTYPVLGKFCGEDTPKFYHDTGAYALVVFTTDDTLSYRGFDITVYLTDRPEDETSSYVIIGIVVGSVIGGIAVLAAASFGVYKLVNRGKDHVPSRDSSRRSSVSSSSSGRYLHDRLSRIHSLRYLMKR